MEEIDIQIPKSWDVLQDGIPGERYAFHKMFPHGEDITISIRESNNGYEIRSYAVAHAAEPSDTINGVAPTLADAVKIAESECKWWEEWIENYWENKSQ